MIFKKKRNVLRLPALNIKVMEIRASGKSHIVTLMVSGRDEQKTEKLWVGDTLEINHKIKIDF